MTKTRCQCRWTDAKDHDDLIALSTSIEAAAHAVMSVVTWDDNDPDGSVAPTDYYDFARVHGWIGDSEASVGGRIMMGLCDLYAPAGSARRGVDFGRLHTDAMSVLGVANDLVRTIERIDVLLDRKEDAASVIDGSFDVEIRDFLRDQPGGES